MKITLLTIVTFMGILSSRAQQGQRRTPEERTKMVIERMTDSLKLTSAQQGDVNTVYLEYYTGQDKLREKLQPGERPEKADTDKLVDARDAKLKIILKEDQFSKLKEMEAAMRQRMQKPPGQ